MFSNRARSMTFACVTLAIGLGANVATAGGVVGPIEKDTIGIFQANSVFGIKNSNSATGSLTFVSFGPSGSVPAMGDFDGNATTTVGVYRASTGEFFQRDANSEGFATRRFRFGPISSTYLPIVGNWNGTGGDSIGLYDPVRGRYLLRNTNSGGLPDVQTAFGPKNAGANIIPIAGNWDGSDAIDGIGFYDQATGKFFLKNDPATGGPADLEFRFGPVTPGMLPVVGNWNNDTTDTVGLYNPANRTFYLRNSNTPGVADLTFKVGPQALTNKPVSGNYNGD